MRLHVVGALVFAVGCANSVEGPGDGSSNPSQPETSDPSQPEPSESEPSEPDPSEPDPSNPDPDAPTPTRRTRVNFLFSGHSLIDNPIPDYAVAIAEAQGDAVDWENQNTPGSTIRYRTENGGYQRGKNRNGYDMDLEAEIADPQELASGQFYDTLVITERHDPLGTIEYEQTLEELLDYHLHMIDALPTARTFLYQSWPAFFSDGIDEWTAYNDVELTLWECIASKVNHTLVARGLPPAVTVLPAGVAFSRLVEAALGGDIPGISGSRAQRLQALFSDDVHPTNLARYMLGAVIYAAAYGASPEGAGAHDELSDAQMLALERLAWDVIADYPATERSMRTLAECRTLIANDVCPAYHDVRRYDGQCAYWGDDDGFFAD